MFESVLERNLPARQIRGGAILAIGVHAVVLIAALSFSTRPSRAIDKQISAIKVFTQPLTLNFTEPSIADKGTSALPGRAQGHKVVRSAPAETDRNKKRTDQPSSSSPSVGESAHGTADPGPVPEGTGGGQGNGPEPGNSGGRGGTMMAIPFGEGMKRPTPIAQPAPVYTREASAVKAAGVVSVRCIITVEGTLKDCRVVQGVPYMDAAVLEALTRWKYTPVTFQGRPVSVYYVINIRLVAP